MSLRTSLSRIGSAFRPVDRQTAIRNYLNDSVSIHDLERRQRFFRGVRLCEAWPQTHLGIIPAVIWCRDAPPDDPLRPLPHPDFQRICNRNSGSPEQVRG